MVLPLEMLLALGLLLPRRGNGDRRRGWGLAVALLLLPRAVGAAAPPEEDRDDFGRWERQVSACAMRVPASALQPAPASLALAAGMSAAEAAPTTPAAAAARTMAAREGRDGGARSAGRQARPDDSRPVATPQGSGPVMARGRSRAVSPPTAAALSQDQQQAAGPAAEDGTTDATNPPGPQAAAVTAPTAAMEATAAASALGSGQQQPAAAGPRGGAAMRPAAGAARGLGPLSLTDPDPEAAASPDPDAPWPCRSVRLDQQLAGLLTIRFLPPLRGAAGSATQLVFTGVLTPTSQPLRCRDGRCQPDGILELQVSAVATGGLDRQGMPTGLPLARLARGSCRLEAQALLCQAQESFAVRWQARARW